MSRINTVAGRAVWDSRGFPTVEAEVTLESGVVGRAIAPAGASTGAGEARELRDGGTRLRGLGVQQAVQRINGEISPLLKGFDIFNQAAIDAAMIAADGTPDKSRLGGNSLTAVSLAALWAAANEKRLPLWRYLAGSEPVGLPLPEIQIFGGGAHARGSVDLQDFLAIPNGATSFAQSLEWIAEVYYAAGRALASQGKTLAVADEGGYWPQFGSNEGAIEALVRAIESAGFKPGADISIGLDLASTQYFADDKYHWRSESRSFTREQLLDVYTQWVDSYPIVSMEDGFAEDDVDGMRAMTARLGHRLQIIGDDFFVTNARQIEERAALGACNAVLIKPCRRLGRGATQGWQLCAFRAHGQVERRPARRTIVGAAKRLSPAADFPVDCALGAAGRHESPVPLQCHSVPAGVAETTRASGVGYRVLSRGGTGAV